MTNWEDELRDVVIETHIDDIIYEIEALDFNSPEARSVVRKTLLTIQKQTRGEMRRHLLTYVSERCNHTPCTCAGRVECHDCGQPYAEEPTLEDKLRNEGYMECFNKMEKVLGDTVEKKYEEFTPEEVKEIKEASEQAREELERGETIPLRDILKEG